MESANILQAVEQYRQQLKTITVEPTTRFFPTHEDDAITTLREYHTIGAHWWKAQTTLTKK